MLRLPLLRSERLPRTMLQLFLLRSVPGGSDEVNHYTSNWLEARFPKTNRAVLAVRKRFIRALCTE